jgi:hypothetical protein
MSWRTSLLAAMPKLLWLLVMGLRARTTLRTYAENWDDPLFNKYILRAKTNKQTPWPLVRERTIPTDRPPLVDEI